MDQCPQCSGCYRKARKIPVDHSVLPPIPNIASRRGSSPSIPRPTEDVEYIPSSPQAPEVVEESESASITSLLQTAPSQTPRYRPPKSFVSTDTSGRGTFLSPNRRNILGILLPRGPSRPPQPKPLPTSLSFLFSATGHTLLLWRRNGHSLVRINMQSHKSRSFPLLNAIPRTDGDREVNVKLVAEGHGRIAVILYQRQVI